MPTFDAVLDELRGFIVGTNIQVLNSDSKQNQPNYSRRYNILIGGTKLARGVTIKNLLVTYYGRQAKSTNMDTVLQHARMFGYREKDLDVTRLFVTPEVEARFRLINESEQALHEVIQTYPNEEYRGILIGRGVRATRTNVLNPNNVGAYVAGRSYFPRKPLFERVDVERPTQELDNLLGVIAPPSKENKSIKVTIDQMIELVKLTQSDPSGSGLWDDDRIVIALEILKDEPKYNNTGFLIVSRKRNLGRAKNGVQMRAMLSAGELDLAEDKKYPTLFMYRLTGAKWGNVQFWLPNIVFPSGPYAVMFNFE